MRDCKTERPQKEEDEKRTVLVQNIQLRLSLIGGMFKTVLQHRKRARIDCVLENFIHSQSDEWYSFGKRKYTASFYKYQKKRISTVHW